ncbi:MAG: hypothetical protein HY561_02765 [Gemmatimonadetes bacterium]|nr:hypothetical protein [Gemmatimonadota bacterium]
MNRVIAVRLLVFAFVGLLAACQDTPEPVAPAESPEEAALVPGPQGGPTDAAVFSRLIPGFGGYFLDEQGRPTVYLTDLAQAGRAQRVLAPAVLQQGRGAAVQVRQGKFTYRQLHGWHTRAFPEVLSLPGAVFTDLDEARNRVTIGVESRGAVGSVEGVLARSRIPREAVRIEVVEPIRLMVTLRDKVRPTVGGLQIRFSQYLCTLGFNATHSAGNSFITNSHCTERQGGTEGTLYYQPLNQTADEFIGTEVDDPVYFRGGACPRGKKCRYSDSSRAAYDASVSFDLGGIAQAGTAPNTGSLTIDGTFNIAAELSGNGTVGAVVNKVGRTTGWTQGTITRSCVNTGVSGSNIVQLCQDWVDAGVGSGDSGSPVFAGTSNVTLYGILWGGTSSGDTFVYSPVANIERELGALATF